MLLLAVGAELPSQVEEGKVVKAIDDMVKGAGTLGDLIARVNEYRENRLDPGMFWQWAKPLEKALEEDERSYIVTLRVLRYAFRRKGYSNTNYIFRPARAVLAALPTLPLSVRGQVPFFDCHLGGGGRRGSPVPGPVAGPF